MRFQPGTYWSTCVTRRSTTRTVLSATGNPGVTRNFPAYAGHRRGRDRPRKCVCTVQEGRRSHRHRFRSRHEHARRLRPANPRAGGMGGAAAGETGARGQHDSRHGRIHRGARGRQARSIGYAAGQRAGIGDRRHRRRGFGCGDVACAARLRGRGRHRQGIAARLPKVARGQGSARPRSAASKVPIVRC